MCKCMKLAKFAAFLVIMISAVKAAMQIAKSAAVIGTASKVIKKIG